jgi:CheY-like chemotaxis protein
MRILVADDMPAGRTLLRRRLELEGHEVRTAEDGVEAVAEARHWRPDLILMDLHMPVCDGIDAAGRLAADPSTSEIRVVALTAGDDPDAVRAALSAGCVAFVFKPIDVASLLHQLDGWHRSPLAPLPT